MNMPTLFSSGEHTNSAQEGEMKLRDTETQM